MNDVSYQMFETYYRRAVAADEAGRIDEARNMYRLASEALLKSARNVQGETKAALIRRADKLSQLADNLENLPPPGQVKESAPQRPANNPERVSEKKEEGTTLWRSEGKTGIRFEDIAGLQDVKDAFYNRVIQPRKFPKLYEACNYQVKGGILLYGPPGTGKTMLAKALASEIDADFFSIRCSDIVGKYFGEAEKNVKGLFDTARKSENAIVFFDEFEALASQRGSDSSVMNRLVPELLSQMDGFSSSGNVLVLAATNRPWDLDTAFLRPPRLTQKIYVGLPDYEARLYLVNRKLKGAPCEEDVSLEIIAEQTEGYNAADVDALCGALKEIAITRSRLEQEARGEVDSGLTLPIRHEDMETAMKNIRSSVQQRDVELIKEWEATQGV